MNIDKSIEQTYNSYNQFLKLGTTKIKNKFLRTLAKKILESSNYILEQNTIDLKKGKEKGLSPSFLDRLTLTEKRIENITNSCLEIEKMDDPVGRVENMVKRPDGFSVGKMSTPIGVIAIIYESRPNVTVEATTLCIKAGNAVVLRGGSDAYYSNKAFCLIIKEALGNVGLDPMLVTFIESREREIVNKIVRMDKFIHCIIPRGGEDLISAVTQNATVPVLKHFKGVCHAYVSKMCDFEMAKRIVLNAKVQRPSTCNSLETLLIDKAIADEFLPQIAELMIKNGVTLFGCAKTVVMLDGTIEQVSEKQLFNEYLDLKMSIKIVDSLDDAIKHINYYSSSHTDTIITNDIQTAESFLNRVDSSCVMVNASTRLSDGGVFGLGAEIGISTDRLHARGPMGINELTTKKWIVKGNGQIRE